MTDQLQTTPSAGPVYAVIGATGQQGGAVARALLDRGVAVRALVRDPDSEPSRTLAGLGASLTRIDLDEPDSLRAGFAGVAGLFAMTTFATKGGTDGEVANGRAIGDAAVAAQVPHLVYSSVGGAERQTGIPHFESKWQVEQYLRGLELQVDVVRPTFFMDNFTELFAPTIEGGAVVLRTPLLPDVALQMIAVDDIGTAVATILLAPGRLPGDAIEIAGDEQTGDQIAAAFGTAAGLPGRLETLPVESLHDPDQEAMFTWFENLPAYTADFDGTRALVPDPLDLVGFAARHRPRSAN